MLNSFSIWHHAFRSLTHVSLFCLGIFYAFSIPYFLNAEVWVYIYTVAGCFLVSDAIVAFKDNKKNLWPLLYALDALFVALIIYKTGYIFLNVLLSVWLLHILFAGIQYSWKAALLQGLWTSILWTGVQFFSAHFEALNFELFTFNSFLILSWSVFCSFTSSCKYRIISFLEPTILKVKNFFSSALHPFTHVNWDVVTQFPVKDFKKEKIDVNNLMSEVMEYCHKQVKFSFIQYSPSIVESFFGYKNLIKQSILYIIQWFVCHYSNPYQKVDIRAFKKEDHLVIEFKKIGNVRVHKSLPLSQWMKCMLFIQKAVDQHQGDIQIQDNIVQIHLPLSETHLTKLSG